MHLLVDFFNDVHHGENSQISEFILCGAFIFSMGVWERTQMADGCVSTINRCSKSFLPSIISFFEQE